MSCRVRKAHVEDVPAIYEILKRFSVQGLLLPRSYVNLYEMLQSFYVAEDERFADRLAGTASLQVAWEDLAELRSLAVEENSRSRGLGRALAEKAEQDAARLKVKKMFVLTFVPEFFIKLGYRQVSLDSLPQKIWAVCFNCVHYPNCKEIALVKDI
ncbi:MAG: N-acetyltransferase [Deltaproteobacteria bacterium]|jgi:amino-acid N-acetyltransferase|nr:N-acetyltransferase [Deltaproteobacteria bacterium]